MWVLSLSYLLPPLAQTCKLNQIVFYTRHLNLYFQQDLATTRRPSICMPVAFKLETTKLQIPLIIDVYRISSKFIHQNRYLCMIMRLPVLVLNISKPSLLGQRCQISSWASLEREQNRISNVPRLD